MASGKPSVSYEQCNKQGKLFAIANRLGYDLEEYAGRYLKAGFVSEEIDADYRYYQLAAPSYSLDLIDDAELHAEEAADGGISNDEAHWIGFFYRYLALALSLTNERVLELVPFAAMRAFYAELGALPKIEARECLLARVAASPPDGGRG